MERWAHFIQLSKEAGLTVHIWTEGPRLAVSVGEQSSCHKHWGKKDPVDIFCAHYHGPHTGQKGTGAEGGLPWHSTPSLRAPPPPSVPNVLWSSSKTTSHDCASKAVSAISFLHHPTTNLIMGLFPQGHNRDTGENVLGTF